MVLVIVIRFSCAAVYTLDSAVFQGAVVVLQALEARRNPLR